MVVVGGGIAIIASDFKKDLEVEIFQDLEIWPDLDPSLTIFDEKTFLFYKIFLVSK